MSFTDHDIVTLNDIFEAREIVKPYIHRTPMMTSTALGEQLGVKLYFKAEVFQKTGSFKPRGTINKIYHLSDEAKSNGVLAISAGNLAAGVAYAATLLGVESTVIMPESAPKSKVEATRGYGATIILHGDVTTLFAKADEVQQERNLTFLEPWGDPDLIAGHGTLGLEILDDVAEPDYVLVPVGGGGLISGVASAIKFKHPRAKVIGVEPVGANVMTQSLEQDRVVSLSSINTIADGLAAPSIGENNLTIVKRYVDDIVLVTDDEIAAAMGAIMERCKIVTEPSGATAFAALLHGKIDIPQGATVVCLLSGANVDRSRLKALL